MIPDRLSARPAAHCLASALTLLLIAVSILGGIALAIACSYRPIALWWVMVAWSAINVFRFGARLSLTITRRSPCVAARSIRGSPPS